MTTCDSLRGWDRLQHIQPCKEGNLAPRVHPIRAWHPQLFHVFLSCSMYLLYIANMLFRNAKPFIRRFGVMVALILLGFVLSIAHHLSYRFLSGKSTADYPQTTVKGISLAVAFIIKSSFATSIGISFQETAWNAVRLKPTNIKTLDQIFATQSNVLGFFSKDAIRTAFAALLLSAIRWTMPLAAIIPPGTLNVRIAIHDTVKEHCYVPTFNNSLGRTWFPGGLGIKINATPDIDKWSYLAVVSNETAFIPSDSFCGTNCSYTQQFVGPHMQCKYTDVDVGQSNDIAPPKPPSKDYNICELNNYPDVCFLSGSAAIHDSSNDGPRDNFTMSYAQSYQRIKPCQLRMNYTRVSAREQSDNYNVLTKHTIRLFAAILKPIIRCPSDISTTSRNTTSQQYPSVCLRVSVLIITKNRSRIKTFGTSKLQHEACSTTSSPPGSQEKFNFTISKQMSVPTCAWWSVPP